MIWFSVRPLSEALALIPKFPPSPEAGTTWHTQRGGIRCPKVGREACLFYAITTRAYSACNNIKPLCFSKYLFDIYYMSTITQWWISQVFKERISHSQFECEVYILCTAFNIPFGENRCFKYLRIISNWSGLLLGCTSVWITKKGYQTNSFFFSSFFFQVCQIYSCRPTWDTTITFQNADFIFLYNPLSHWNIW